MLILNETQFTEDLINKQLEFPYSTLSRTAFIKLLCRYYKTDENYYDKITEILKFYFPQTFYKEQWGTKIKNEHNKCVKDDLCLTNRECICIYQSDIEKVKALDDIKLQKLLLTAMFLARFHDNEGWVGTYSIKEYGSLFKLANLSVTKDIKLSMINELYNLGFIAVGKKNTNVNLKIDLWHNDVVQMEITDLQNIGNQYVAKFVSGWKMCTVCNKIFRTKSTGRPPIYCNKCAIKINQEKTKENIKSKRS
ncbi:MAG: hypothetical protein RSF40_06745 [Oscillospiraceae bacterium]